MLPLMRMTWVINRRLLIGFSPVLAFYLAMLVYTQTGAAGPPFAFTFRMLITLIAGVVVFQGLSLEVEGFVLSLPVSRPQVVTAKYLTSLLGLLGGLALPLATSWVAHGVAPVRVPAPSPEFQVSMGLWTVFLAFALFLMLPCIHHFGASKGLLVFALLALLLPTIGLAWKGLDGAQAMLTAAGELPRNPLRALVISAGVGALGVASWVLSVWSYKRRYF